jgi:phenylpropionate dioxygenase-like ring-hydroxylating dioxygenase large terminal subunit
MIATVGVGDMLHQLPGAVQPNLVTDHIVGASAWGLSYLALAASLTDQLERGRSDAGVPPGTLGFVADDDSTLAPNRARAPRAPPMTGPKPAQLPAPPPGADVSLSSESRASALRDRSRFLDHFWYCAAIAAEVTADKPTGVTMLGMQLVLMRDAATGAVHCLQDACPHRGAPLSTGWMARLPGDGTSVLVCGYHGWQIDGHGRLHAVPANSDGESLPQRPLVETFPVREEGGFIWLWYGDAGVPEDVRAPLPIIPELSLPGWRAVHGEFTFDAPHQSVFENAIDFAHIHYLHSSSFGNQDAPKVRNMTAESDAWGVLSTFSINNKPVSPLWEWTRVPEVLVHAKALLPCTSVVGFTLAHNIKMITFVNTVPIDGNKSLNRFALLRNFAHGPALGPLEWVADRIAVRAMKQIMAEDKAMVDTLRPELVAKEVHVRADLVQVEFRKLRQQWLNLGYGVDPPQKALADAAAARAACTAGCSLPSPDSR